MEHDDNPGIRCLYETFSKDTYKPDGNWCLPSEFQLDPLLNKNQFENIVIPKIDNTDK
jgi:hypothetical protein